MIIVFGSINIDLVTEVEVLPTPGHTRLGPSYEVHPGGKGANQALAAKRAGADVALVGAVGQDAFAQPALALLEAAEVDTSKVKTIAGPTGAAFIARGPRTADAIEKENMIVVAQGANLHASAGSVGETATSQPCTLLLQREVPDEQNMTAARLMRDRNYKTILNLAPSDRLSEKVYGENGLLSVIDVLIVNQHEAGELAGALKLPGDHASLAAALHERFDIGVTVVTLGKDGAVGWNEGKEHRVSSHSVEAIDPTAAGDSFAGFFAAAFDAGLPLNEAMRRGTAAGSLACTRAGAQPSIPDAAAVDALLRRG